MELRRDIRHCIGLTLFAIFAVYVWGALFTIHMHVLPTGLNKHAHPYSVPTHNHTTAEYQYIDAVMSFQCEDAVASVTIACYEGVRLLESASIPADRIKVAVTLRRLRAPPALALSMA